MWDFFTIRPDVKAKKDYTCDGREQIIAYCNYDDELKGKIDFPLPHKIHAGEKHFVQSGKAEGDFHNWRSCHACHAIIIKHSLYEE